MLTSLDAEHVSLWKTAKALRKTRSSISALTGHTGIAYSDTDRAETLANSLEKQFQQNDISNSISDINHTRLVTRFFKNENNFDDTPTLTQKPLKS
ncbi:hypothetical protein TNCV_4561111 [Trichonephila clavipes]|nr:hypothetical protein TNCV_4561111 [Trichonephila clavipes]